MGRGGLQGAPVRIKEALLGKASGWQFRDRDPASAAQKRFGLSVDARLRLIRLELKPGPFSLRREKEGRSRMTALGLAVRKAWRDLPREFPGLIAHDLRLHAKTLEGVIGFPPASGTTGITEVVRRFKGLCQDRFALLRDEPGDLWAPGFVEGPLREHFGPSAPAD